MLRRVLAWFGPGALGPLPAVKAGPRPCACGLSAENKRSPGVADRTRTAGEKSPSKLPRRRTGFIPATSSERSGLNSWAVLATLCKSRGKGLSGSCRETALQGVVMEGDSSSDVPPRAKRHLRVRNQKGRQMHLMVGRTHLEGHAPKVARKTHAPRSALSEIPTGVTKVTWLVRL